MNRQQNDAFSVVEVMISLAILSIVLAVILQFVSVGAGQYVHAKCHNEAEFLARAKLSELQDLGNEPSNGSDTVHYNSRKYVRIWTLSGTELCLATVSVSWNAAGNQKKTLSASGYIESNSDCRSIAPNNPPKVIDLFKSDGKKILIDTVKISHGTPANRFVAACVGIDPDTILGDRVRITFESNSLSQSGFKLSGDTLFTDTLFDIPEQAYPVTIVATDCSMKNVKSRQIIVWVKPKSTKPKAESPQRFSVVESHEIALPVGNLVADEPMTADLSWVGTSANFALNSTGTLSVSNTLNFESKPLDTLQVRLHRTSTNEDSLVQVIVSVRDTNESPYDILLKPASVKKGVASGTTIGEIAVKDPDSASVQTQWRMHTLIISGKGSDRFELKDRILSVKNSEIVTVGTDTVQIMATDLGGLSFTKKLPITVFPPDPKCSDYAAYNANLTYPTAGTIVTHLQKIWKSKWYASPRAIPGTAAEWQEVGICQ